MTYDAIVVGLGGMGSAVLAHTARRGMRVLGIEQFARAHELGSSSGRSRIIRQAYFEAPAYVPLVQRAYALWAALEKQTALPLFHRTGVLLAGAAGDPALAGARSSAGAFGVEIEELTASEIRQRYPRLAPRAGEIGIFESNAGYLVPELAIEAHLRSAAAAGAQACFETPVTAWNAGADLIDVELADGSRHRTRRLAVCVGPWFEAAAREFDMPLVVERRVQHWFAPADGYARADVPAFILARPEFASSFYGFPDRGEGVKAAFHHLGEVTTPERLDRSVSAADIAPVRAALDGWIPGAAGRYLGGKACMYTLTPDEHFVLGLHPHDARIAVAGGFSGHGFKFAAVIGEIVAGLLADGATPHEIGFLSPRRFAGRNRPPGYGVTTDDARSPAPSA